MKVMTWHGGARFTHDDVPDPKAEPGFVVVEIDTTGICGTDVHITQGLFPSDAPKILGHEGSGVIVDVGEGVSKERIGQRVVLNHSAHCYECWNCRELERLSLPGSTSLVQRPLRSIRLSTLPSRSSVTRKSRYRDCGHDRAGRLLPLWSRDARHPLPRHRTRDRRGHHGAVYGRVHEVSRR